MPTYEFRCPKGHDFEKFYRSISGAPVNVHCPVCGELAKRQLSGAGLVFKGSGFYITDYGKDGKGPAKSPETADTKVSAEKTDSAAAKSAESSSTASESKPSDGSKPAAGDSKSSTASPAPAPAPAPTKSKKKE